jgi:hypothetical protein
VEDGQALDDGDLRRVDVPAVTDVGFEVIERQST